MIVEKNDARLGLFVLGAAAAFLALVVYKNAPKVTENSYALRVQLDQLSGLDVGTAVQLQGYRVGRVERIELKREGTVYHLLATVSVQQNIQLWEGTRARVEGQGLGGSVLDLDLPAPTDRQRVLGANELIQGEPGSSLDSVIAKADDLMGSLNGMVADLRLSFQKKGAGVVLDHPAVAKALRDLDATLLEFQGVARKGGELADQAKPAVDSLDKGMADLQAAMAQLRKLLDTHSGDLDQTLTSLAAVTKQMEGLTASLQETLKTEGPQADQTLRGLKRVTLSLEELLELLKQKPHRAMWGSIPDDDRAKAKKNVDEARAKDEEKK